MRGIALIVIIFAMLLAAGCCGISAPNNSPAANAPTQQGQTPTQTYACPDGSIVTDLAECPRSQAPVQQSQPTPTQARTYSCQDGKIVTNLAECPKCPTLCDDNNPCTKDTCGLDTNYKCKNEILSGSQAGCSGNLDNCMEQTCSVGVCTTQKQSPYPKCVADSDCNDNKPNTVDKCNAAGTCHATCSNNAVTSCTNGDGICPSNCDVFSDSDCNAFTPGTTVENSKFKMTISNPYIQICTKDYGDHAQSAHLVFDLSVEIKSGQDSVYMSSSEFNVVDSAKNQYDGSIFNSPSSLFNEESVCKDYSSNAFDSGNLMGGTKRSGKIWITINEGGANYPSGNWFIVYKQLFGSASAIYKFSI